MIQVIDESTNSAAELVMDKLLAWNRDSQGDACNEELPDEVMHDWLNLLEGTKISDLMKFYGETVRSVLFEDGRLLLLGIPVLQCYGRLVSLYGQMVESTRSEHESLTRVMKMILTDILALTNPPSHEEEEKEDSSDRFRLLRTIVLPTLIGMITTILVATPSNSQFARSISNRIAAVLLAFQTAQLNSLTLHPSLDHIDLMNECVVPHNDAPCIIVWDVVELDASSWKDDHVVLASMTCWHALAQHLGLRQHADNDMVLKRVCFRLGWQAVAKAVRAQFFGREEEEENTRSRPLAIQPPRTYPLEITTPLPTEPPHRREHARIHAALIFVGIIESPNHRVLTEVLPFCYTLIDSSVASLVAMGCAALLVLLSKCPYSDDWKEFEDAMISVLDVTAKSSVDPVSVGFVCLACSKAFEVLTHRGKDRRRLTVRFLDLVMYRMRHQSDESGMLRNILIGALIPLIKQQSASAEGMELGRRGLQLFLPLIQWDVGLSGRKVQVAALVALINLMYAAYPIMPHHGEKIICEVVACRAHAYRLKADDAGLDEEEKGLCLALLALADSAIMTALVLCGESARRTLVEIQTSQLDPIVVEHAASMLQKYKPPFREEKEVSTIET